MQTDDFKLNLNYNVLFLIQPDQNILFLKYQFQIIYDLISKTNIYTYLFFLSFFQSILIQISIISISCWLPI